MPEILANLLTLDVADPMYAIKKGDKPGLVPGSEEAKNIWNRFIQEYDIFCRFWAPRYEVARKCNRYRRRDIFDKTMRDEYLYVYDKIPVEPQEMKQVINILAGQIAQTVKGGAIEMEDQNPPKNAASPAVVNIVVKALENRLKLDRKKKGALREALYGGVPNWIWFDRERTAEGAYGNLRATLLPWDSALCSFLFLEEDGSDIDHLKRVSHKTKWEMFDTYPDRREVFESHMELLNTQPDFYNNILGFDQSLNSEDRRDIFFPRITTGRYDAIQGFIYAIESTYVIHQKREVQINEKTKDVVILPPEWEDWEIMRWHNQNPDYNLTKKQDIKTLWVTTIDNTGFVWENSAHWFQVNGKLPGRCYIPAIEDKIPTGVGEDMLPYVLSIATAETEGLHQVRTGSGDVTHLVEGALLKPENLGKELSKANGAVLYKKSVVEAMANGLNGVYKREVRQPNESYLKFADRMREQKKEINNINPSIMGQISGRQNQQQKIAEITQTMVMHAQFIENYTNFNLELIQLMVDMMPYCFNEYQLVEISDEFGKKVGPIEVNNPQMDQGPDAAVTLINDLTSAKYRVIPVASDDSPTNREKEMKEFQAMIAAVGNTLLQIDPAIIAAIWKDWPNRFCREAAAGLDKLSQSKAQGAQQKDQAEKQAEAQKVQTQAAVEMEKVKRPRWNIRLDPRSLDEAPEGFKMMMDTLQAINQNPGPVPPQGAPAPGGTPAPQQPQPSQQGKE